MEDELPDLRALREVIYAGTKMDPGAQVVDTIMELKKEFRVFLKRRLEGACLPSRSVDGVHWLTAGRTAVLRRSAGYLTASKIGSV